MTRRSRVSLTLLVGLAAIIGVSGCAMDRAQTSRRLEFEVGWVRDTIHTGYNGLQGSQFMKPVLDDQMVYQGNAVDGLGAYDRKSGNLRWKVQVKNGVSSGAFVSGDRLYFGGSDGQFYCVEKQTGRIDWTFPARAEILAPPTVANGSVYFLAANNILYALDAGTGKQRWLYSRTQTAGLSIRSGSQPVVVDENLYVGFSDGALVALKTADGSLTWERVLTTNGRFRDVDGRPLVFEDLLIVGTYSDGLYAITRKDGQVRWRFDEGGADSAILKGNTLYFSTERNRIVALDAKTGKENWAWTSRAGALSEPTLYHNFLLVGESRGDLVALNLINGQLEAQYSTGRGVSAAPLADEANNQIFVFSSAGNLFRLGLNYIRNDAADRREL